MYEGLEELDCYAQRQGWHEIWISNPDDKSALYSLCYEAIHAVDWEPPAPPRQTWVCRGGFDFLEVVQWAYEHLSAKDLDAFEYLLDRYITGSEAPAGNALTQRICQVRKQIREQFGITLSRA